MCPHTCYTFTGKTGTLLGGWLGWSPHGLMVLYHSAKQSAWSDPAIHMHSMSEEYYLVRQGCLHILVDELLLDLRPDELLFVKAGTPHAIIGGKGSIEHFGLRAPDRRDKVVVRPLPADTPPMQDGDREMIDKWGARIPLYQQKNQNCWLLGSGTALHVSNHLSLAYMLYDNDAPANDGIGTRFRTHLHQFSWEYYIVLQGSEVLEIDGKLVDNPSGSIISVAPGTPHNLHSRQTPFSGLTLRVPVLEKSDKIEIDQ